MAGRTKIAIFEPGREESGKYFSLRLKSRIEEEHPVFMPAPKIVVISNFNGKFKALLHALLVTGVINEKGKWIFGEGHLVVFGGNADFEAATLACQWYLYGLEERAMTNGGRIHYIASMGEIAGLSTHWPLSHPSYANSISHKRKSYAVLYDGNNELKRWLLTKNLMEKIGPLLFVNSVIPSEFFHGNLPISFLNKKLRHLYFHHSIANFEIFYDEFQLNQLATKYQIETVITAAIEENSVISKLHGKWLNVSSDLRENFIESLMIIKDHYYRFNTNGLKERLK